MQRALVMATSWALLGCNGPVDSETHSDEDTEPIVEIDACEELRLPVRAFESSGTTGSLRGDLAADFTVPLVGDGTFGLAADWTGCDVLVVLTQNTPVSSTNGASVWTTGTAELVERSPDNARYLFVPRGLFGDAAKAATDALQADIEATLGAMDEDDAAWWRGRLLVSAVESQSIQGWAGELLQLERARDGFVVDREQRVGSIGSLQAGFAPEVADGEHEARLYAAAYEAHYRNFQAKRQEQLDAAEQTEVVLLDGSVVEGPQSVEVALPDAASLAKMDMLWIDLTLGCPDPTRNELDDCPAGGQLAQVWLDMGDGERMEIARGISPYRREVRWVRPSPWALAVLREGGTRRFHLTWGSDDAPEKAAIALSLRFADTGSGRVPARLVPLWTGGPIHAGFNDEREPRIVTRSASEVDAELWTLVSGHGEGLAGCASMCTTGHTFHVGNVRFGPTLAGTGKPDTCYDGVRFGLVPNQAGAWWAQRAGWCVGGWFSREGSSWVENMPVGEPVTYRYELVVNGGPPREGDYGTIEMGSWLVMWE